MKTIQARIDESIVELIHNLNALVGEVALETLARRMQQKPKRDGQRPQRRSSAQSHREPEEIAALAEELYAQICHHPGETMLTLSKYVKQPSKMLSFPARKLVEASQVKKVGQRQFTRYFPVGQEAKRAPRPKAR
jgi:hypothetical protein